MVEDFYTIHRSIVAQNHRQTAWPSAAGASNLFIDGTAKMAYEIEIQELPLQPTLSIRATTTPAEIANVLSRLFGRVLAYAQQRGAEIVGHPFTRYYAFDDKTVQVEAGLPVAAPLEGKDEIVAGALPAGPAAMTVHVGPYSRLAAAHVAIGAWLEEHGRQVAGPPWEIYVTDPRHTADPEEWRTQVVYPLK